MPDRVIGTATVRLFHAVLLVASMAPAARAEQLPLWEAGLGATVISFPHYRGSDERQSWVLPFPYVVYRGEFLQADERRVRGLFFKTERAELDVSINGTPPVDSDENEARRGMPDLDATLEIGPSLNFLLLRTDDRKTRLELRLPVRVALATDLSHVNLAGWVFQPNLNVDIRDPFGFGGWNLGALAGPMFSDRRYHQYFYGVEPAFAMPGRPAYNADGDRGGSGCWTPQDLPRYTTGSGVLEGVSPDVGYYRWYDPGTQPLPCWEWSSWVSRGLVQFDLSPLAGKSKQIARATLEYDATYEWRSHSGTVAQNYVDEIVSYIAIVNGPWGQFDIASQPIINVPESSAVRPGRTEHFSFTIPHGYVRDWVNGTRPNHGLLFVGWDESLPSKSNGIRQATLRNLVLKVELVEPK